MDKTLYEQQLVIDVQREIIKMHDKIIEKLRSTINTMDDTIQILYGTIALQQITIDKLMEEQNNGRQQTI